MLNIPILNVPAQTLAITLEGILINLGLAYNNRTQAFTFSVTTEKEDIQGLRLVSGIPLLKAFNLLRGDLIVFNATDAPADPILGDFGNGCDLFYFTEMEIKALK